MQFQNAQLVDSAFSSAEPSVNLMLLTAGGSHRSLGIQVAQFIVGTPVLEEFTFSSCDQSPDNFPLYYDVPLTEVLSWFFPGTEGRISCRAYSIWLIFQASMKQSHHSTER